MGHYDNIIELESELNGDDLRIGIVMSRFNIDVGEGLLGALHALAWAIRPSATS